MDFLCAFNSGNQRARPPVCAKQSSRACFEVFQIALNCGQPKTVLNMMGIHNKINGFYTGSCFLYGNNSNSNSNTHARTLKLESSSPPHFYFLFLHLASGGLLCLSTSSLECLDEFMFLLFASQLNSESIHF